MIDMETITKELQAVLAILDAEEYPAAYAYLSSLLEEDGCQLPEPHDIANALIQRDAPTPFSRILTDLIIALLEAEIDEGNADATNDLGALYYSGSRGFPQSFKQAVRLYKLAAKHGSRQATENLGYCYYYGRDGEPDYEKAFHCFATGAFEGRPVSMYKIGDMYLNGYYVEHNETEAFRVYLHCLESMTQETEALVAGPVYLRLGKAFLRGRGTEPDPKSALVCFQKAESYLYDQVRNGEVMYRNSLEVAVEGQSRARALLADHLPGEHWEWDG